MHFPIDFLLLYGGNAHFSGDNKSLDWIRNLFFFFLSLLPFLLHVPLSSHMMQRQLPFCSPFHSDIFIAFGIVSIRAIFCCYVRESYRGREREIFFFFLLMDNVNRHREPMQGCDNQGRIVFHT